VSAPFKSAALRDPFNAFVCDDETLELIRAAANDMGWPIEKCNKGGLRNAVQSLSVSASPNILFVDMSESGDPINDINALAEVCEPGTVVIAAGQVNDVRACTATFCRAGFRTIYSNPCRSNRSANRSPWHRPCCRLRNTPICTMTNRTT